MVRLRDVRSVCRVWLRVVELCVNVMYVFIVIIMSCGYVNMHACVCVCCGGCRVRVISYVCPYVVFMSSCVVLCVLLCGVCCMPCRVCVVCVSVCVLCVRMCYCLRVICMIRVPCFHFGLRLCVCACVLCAMSYVW